MSYEEISVEEMWKVIESFGIDRRMLERTNPSNQKIKDLYQSIKSKKIESSNWIFRSTKLQIIQNHGNQFSWLRKDIDKRIVMLAIQATNMAEETPVKKSFIQEFMEFLQKFSVIGLAIAFVIGQAASKLISSFVNDIITPFIGLLTPDVGDLNKIGITVGKSTFSYGDLISNVINFLIIAVVVFLAYKQLSKVGLMKDPPVNK